MTDVRVDDLKRALSLLLDRVEVAGGVVRIDREAFWSVPEAQAYDVYVEPTELTIGMVSESWEQVEAMLSDPDRAVGHGLICLAEVLRAIASEGRAT